MEEQTVRLQCLLAAAAAAVCALRCSVVPTLCDPMDCSPPGSSVHETFRARILKWVAVSSAGIFLTQEPVSPASAGRFFATEPPGKPSASTVPLLLVVLRPAVLPHYH